MKQYPIVCQRFAGCNLDNGYCIHPGQCICHVGWSGSQCTECVVQQNCPGKCSVPAGCVCPDSQVNINGICQIKNNPPKVTQHNIPHTMDQGCLIYNKIWNENYARNISANIRAKGIDY